MHPKHETNQYPPKLPINVKFLLENRAQWTILRTILSQQPNPCPANIVITGACGLYRHNDSWFERANCGTCKIESSKSSSGNEMSRYVQKYRSHAGFVSASAIHGLTFDLICCKYEAMISALKGRRWLIER
jgi:hypothetical protein